MFVVVRQDKTQIKSQMCHHHDNNNNTKVNDPLQH